MSSRKVIHIYHMQRSGGHALAWWLGGDLLINDAVSAFAFGPPPSEVRSQVEKASRVIVTVEDSFLVFSYRFLESYYLAHDIPIDIGSSEHVVLVRSVDNLFASRVKFPQECKAGNMSDEAMLLWCQHAEAVMEQASECFPRLVGVYFDKLVSSPLYRSRLADRLMVEDRDWPSKTIGASSFQGGSVLARVTDGLRMPDHMLAMDAELRNAPRLS